MAAKSKISSCSARFIGIVSLLLLIFGVLICILGAIYVADLTIQSSGAAGLWSGAVILLVASFGLATWNTRSFTAAIVFVTFSFVAAVVSLVQTIVVPTGDFEAAGLSDGLRILAAIGVLLSMLAIIAGFIPLCCDDCCDTPSKEQRQTSSQGQENAGAEPDGARQMLEMQPARQAAPPIQGHTHGIAPYQPTPQPPPSQAAAVPSAPQYTPPPPQNPQFAPPLPQNLQFPALQPPAQFQVPAHQPQQQFQVPAYQPQQQFQVPPQQPQVDVVTVPAPQVIVPGQSVTHVQTMPQVVTVPAPQVVVSRPGQFVPQVQTMPQVVTVPQVPGPYNPAAARRPAQRNIRRRIADGLMDALNPFGVDSEVSADFSLNVDAGLDLSGGLDLGCGGLDLGGFAF